MEVASEAARFLRALTSSDARDTVVEQGGIEVCLEILREKNDVLYEHMLLALQYLAKEEAFAIRMA